MSLFGKGVIFDLDGVLVDTDVCHFLSWKRITDELGIRFSEADNHQLRGVSRRDSLLLLTGGGTGLGEDKIEELLRRKNEIYLGMVAERGASLLAAGAREFVESLRKLGCATALSSCSRNVLRILEVTGLGRGLFDAVVDGNMTSRSKPDPEIFLMSAEMIGAPPRRCVVFEDAQTGVDAAARAGMSAFGVGPAPLRGCLDQRAGISMYAASDVEAALANS